MCMSVLTSLGWGKLSFSFPKAMFCIPHKVTRGFYAPQVQELASLFGIWNVGIPRLMGVVLLLRWGNLFLYRV